MTTATLIISIISILVLLAIAWGVYSLVGMVTAAIYGLQDLIGLVSTCYAHHNYTNSAIKIILDDLETRNTNRMQKAVDSNDFQMANYYKSLLEAIVRLKTMSNSEIEETDN